MELNPSVFADILDAYPYQVVFCDRNHIVRHMNKKAKELYKGRVEIGTSLFHCHNENSRAKIEEFLKRADAGEPGEFFETWNARRGEREFFVPVRNAQGQVIGYFERHEPCWSMDHPEELYDPNIR